MSKFDFKKYHILAMNAKDDEEKNKINAELKFLYEALTEDNKKIFNAELQYFLENEVSKIDSLRNGASLN